MEDLRQRGLAQPAQRFRRQGEPVVVALHPALPAQLPLQFAQPAQVVGGGPAELALHRLHVDVVERRAGMLLAELVDQLVQVADLAEGRGRVAVAEVLTSPHPLAAAPVHAGSQRLQVVGELGQLAAQRAVAERLVHQVLQLLALLRAQRPHQALGRGGLPGQGVDQLVDVLRVVREELPVLVHEVTERVVGVLAAGVLLQQLVEVAHHGGHFREVPVLQGVPHPGEALLDDLALQPVQDLLVDVASFRRCPVVFGQFRDGLRRGPRQVVQDRLVEARVHVVARPQRVPLGGQRLVEHLPGPGDRPVQVAPAQRLLAEPAGPVAQVVQPAAVARAAADQVTQGVAQAVALHDPLAHLVDGGAHVVRRGERVGPVPPRAVPENVTSHRQLP